MLGGLSVPLFLLKTTCPPCLWAPPHPPQLWSPHCPTLSKCPACAPPHTHTHTHTAPHPPCCALGCSTQLRPFPGCVYLPLSTARAPPKGSCAPMGWRPAPSTIVYIYGWSFCGWHPLSGPCKAQWCGEGPGGSRRPGSWDPPTASPLTGCRGLKPRRHQEHGAYSVS